MLSPFDRPFPFLLVAGEVGTRQHGIRAEESVEKAFEHSKLHKGTEFRTGRTSLWFNLAVFCPWVSLFYSLLSAIDFFSDLFCSLAFSFQAVSFLLLAYFLAGKTEIRCRGHQRTNFQVTFNKFLNPMFSFLLILEYLLSQNFLFNPDTGM